MLFRPTLRHTARTYRWQCTRTNSTFVKPSQFGQPLHPSHPHLVKDGELTPGIHADEYESRRRALMEGLPPNSLVICAAAKVKYMSGRTYKFRQGSDFLYLSGLLEPSAAFLLRSSPSTPRGYTYSIFHHFHTPSQALWDGPRTNDITLHDLFGADDVCPIDELPRALKKALRDADYVYVDQPQETRRTRKSGSAWKALLEHLAPASLADAKADLLSALSDLGARSGKIRPLAPEVGRLRAIKSPAEQKIMRAAADVSAHAHTKTMRFAQPGMSEHVLAAHFEYLCAREWSQRPAYVPVVASGPNALTIHYTANDQLIREDELVLIDAGCELDGYASDITRTFPASGRFTPAQAELYSAVLAAQKRLVSLSNASAGYSLYQLHTESVHLLADELRAIGFNLDRSSVGLMAELYPHFVGHPVGIDLHESSHFDRDAPLKPGMVITIEPGIYVPPRPHYPKHFHNIGIRIEDEVLVGETYPTVLSVNAPKEVADVEGACTGALGLEPL
ncbi:hypothetical protein WOLCODRAFT_100967 [Wolfiporia cocos MD-104 SS10]|uniref:Aminopeptidase P N-terminal domain-containing protein n=1 Tax=Wolfiporia cocos (strain MD-104) TaxID=742152 RepID=A0A2H3JZP3_WOLCO|nr:hypothetical protein WOLCODRAFT_100967 [Wolfiporia cocos MD-104 SS10]